MSTETRQAPTLALMHVAFVLTGMGTLLLGPILPVLSRNWHLTDAQSGLMPLAQFAGSTLGGLTLSARLGRGLLVGLGAAAVGLTVFAAAPGLGVALAGLAVGGFGIGRVITAINVMAGAHYTVNRGVVLTWLNFSWGFGALLSPLAAAWLAPRVALATLLFVFAGLFLAVGVAVVVQFWRAPRGTVEAAAAGDTEGGLGVGVYAAFVALLLLYGGLETSLGVWLTTYALRYGRSSLVLSEYTLVLLLFGLTAGRAGSAWLLLRMTDRMLQRVALSVSIVLIGALALVHTAGGIAALAVLLGVALAPVFPSTFALLMDRRPRARQAGAVIAASGVGAAAIPWLIGVVSTRSGSLELALALPVAAAAAMLAISMWVGRVLNNWAGAAPGV